MTIQRVRVRWSAAGRGAPHADARCGLDRPVTLPVALPNCEVVLHEVVADETAGYVRHDEGRAGGLSQAREVGLWLGHHERTLVVDRMPEGSAYPVRRGRPRLFVLEPGQVGRYRANFRFTGCACAPRWYYESWTIHVSNGPVPPDRFIHGHPNHDIDERVNLYGQATSGR